MRRWGRIENHAGAFCGYCVNRLINKGDPALFVTLDGLKRPMLRCVDCSGPAPPDLPFRDQPPKPELTNFAESFKPVKDAMPERTRGALKQAVKEWMPYRDRQPGEDD